MKDFLSNHHAGTYNVLSRTGCENLQELANEIRASVNGSPFTKNYSDFYQLWGLRNVGKTWIKEFCLKYNLVAEYSAWEVKNKAPFFWIFSERKPSTVGKDRVTKKLNALRKTASFYGYKEIAGKCDYYLSWIDELRPEL